MTMQSTNTLYVSTIIPYDLECDVRESSLTTSILGVYHYIVFFNDYCLVLWVNLLTDYNCFSFFLFSFFFCALLYSLNEGHYLASGRSPPPPPPPHLERNGVNGVE